jgi:hypothetical protein
MCVISEIRVENADLGQQKARDVRGLMFGR